MWKPVTMLDKYFVQQCIVFRLTSLLLFHQVLIDNEVVKKEGHYFLLQKDPRIVLLVSCTAPITCLAWSDLKTFLKGVSVVRTLFRISLLVSLCAFSARAISLSRAAIALFRSDVELDSSSIALQRWWAPLKDSCRALWAASCEASLLLSNWC